MSYEDIKSPAGVFLLGIVLLGLTLFYMAGSRPEDMVCMRVIARLPVDPQWDVKVQAAVHKAGVCIIAEKLEQERHYADQP